MSDDEKGTEPPEESRKTASADPFATGGLDFDAAEKRRQRAIEKAKAKQAELGIEMDGDIAVRKIGSLFDDDPPAPTSTSRKTRSSGDTPDAPPELSQEEQEAEMLRKMKEMNDRERERNTIRVGEKTLTKWPYDDYHRVQKEYWEHYFQREEQARLKRQQRLDGSESDSSISVSSSEDDEDEDFSASGSESSSESSSSSDSSHSETSEERLDRKRSARRERKRLERRQRRKQEKKRIKRLNRDTEVEQERRRKLRQKTMEEERQAGLHDLKSDILVFERPQDPPDIKQAVAGLPLTEFELVAKERAIAIASTWLFDAGLVQELMQTKKVKDNNSEIPEEEKKKKIEIKIVPLGGEKKKKETENQQRKTPKRTKMDYEIEKLEKTVRKQLDLINNRLNNGVASSGYEVQELVNSVVSTKSELVRLRETSSMLSNAGDTLDGVSGAAATQTTFAINKYPHLKFAINARKNMQKCFRELAFFSQIPENCARLQNELSEAEYSENEMTTLRNVCKEHVQLEIFLVEAEAGMRKQQVDDDDDDDDGRRRSGVGFKRTGLDVGLPHNNDDVDRFLKEHVQIVLELGDEIQQKIRFGIGTSFELAFNNPAGMVALVEAVEIYETANRTYQAVHGDEGNKVGGPKSLRFTDMRALALRELYEDMSERYACIIVVGRYQLARFGRLLFQFAQAFNVLCLFPADVSKSLRAPTR